MSVSGNIIPRIALEQLLNLLKTDIFRKGYKCSYGFLSFISICVFGETTKEQRFKDIGPLSHDR